MKKAVRHHLRCTQWGGQRADALQIKGYNRQRRGEQPQEVTNFRHWHLDPTHERTKEDHSGNIISVYAGVTQEQKCLEVSQKTYTLLIQKEVPRFQTSGTLWQDTRKYIAGEIWDGRETGCLTWISVLKNPKHNRGQLDTASTVRILHELINNEILKHSFLLGSLIWNQSIYD